MGGRDGCLAAQLCRSLWTIVCVWLTRSDGVANGFSPFNSLVAVERFTDDRQLLLPTLNFSCNATIVAWSLALTSTVSDSSPTGSIALQVWRNRSGAADGECLELVQEVIYSQVLSRNERVQLTLRDTRFFLDVSEGDFLGFFLYEEGLSPLYDPDSSNMTVLRSSSKEFEYCFVNDTVSPDGESARSVSPMVMVELASECTHVGCCPFGLKAVAHAESGLSLCSSAGWANSDAHWRAK